MMYIFEFMGNEYSGMRSIEDVEKEYSEVRREYNDAYGSVIIYQHRQSVKLHIVMKEKVSTSQEEMNKYIERVKERSLVRSNNISPLIEIIGTII